MTNANIQAQQAGGTLYKPIELPCRLACVAA